MDAENSTAHTAAPTPADAAVDWLLRQQAIDAPMDDSEWQSFILWLEADPTHAAAFDRLVLADGLAAVALRSAPAALPPLSPAAANDDQPASGSAAPQSAARRFTGGWRWGLGGGAIAAGLALLLVQQAPASRPYAIVTAPGEQRLVELAGGSRIFVNGGTRLSLDHAQPRRAELVSGEAVFHIRHDAADPFRLVVGGRVIEDAGTVFNVVNDAQGLGVAVAEGAVVFEPGRSALRLGPGDAVAAPAVGAPRMLHIAATSIGGWRQGRLAFNGQPLASLAAAVFRLRGITMILAPGLSQKPFTGIVTLTGNAEKDVPHIAALIGAHWRREKGRWYLSDGGHRLATRPDTVAGTGVRADLAAAAGDGGR
jgi:transmembrane sensor